MTPEKGFAEEKASSSNGLERRPKLRFPGYEKHWSCTKLSYLFRKITAKNTGADIKNVICNSAKRGLVPQREYFDKDIANSDNTTGYYVIEKNDFVYNPRKSQDSPYGPVSRYILDAPGIVSPLYLCFRANKDVNTDFFSWYFHSPAWYRYIYMTGDSGARHDRVSIKDNDFFAMPICLPSSEEQNKIAAFLDLLETRIEKQQNLVESLKKYKKGLLQNLFPRKGETVPRLRLTGFTGDWEQCKFKNAFNLLTNNTLSRAELSSDCGIAQNIHYGDILIKFGEVIDLKNVRLPYIADETKISKSALLQNGDIIIADTAEDTAVGKCVEIVGISDMDVVAGLHTIPCRPRKQYAQGYLGYFMNAPAYHDQLLPLMQGTKVTSVSKSALQDTVLYYPTDITEQARIGDYFTGFDILITRHRRVLDSLIQCKKGLLQQLFI